MRIAGNSMDMINASFPLIPICCKKFSLCSRRCVVKPRQCSDPDFKLPETFKFLLRGCLVSRDQDFRIVPFPCATVPSSVFTYSYKLAFPGGGILLSIVDVRFMLWFSEKLFPRLSSVALRSFSSSAQNVVLKLKILKKRFLAKSNQQISGFRKCFRWTYRHAKAILKCTSTVKESGNENIREGYMTSQYKYCTIFKGGWSQECRVLS